MKHETINQLHHISKDLDATATMLNEHGVKLTASPVEETIERCTAV